jgi:CDP-diacylglycerol---glycerol-3-phosphate 3-phosphatidyltransferase
VVLLAVLVLLALASVITIIQRIMTVRVQAAAG